LRCTGQNNQLTAINAHVGYVLFTVVMTTFTVAPSSGVPYADALFSKDSISTVKHAGIFMKRTLVPTLVV